jgi:hypothetical protein
LCLAACAGEQIPPRDDTDDENGVSCLPEISIAMRYTGRVERSNAPVAGASARLLDVAAPSSRPFAEFTTGADGRFELAVDALPWFPDCYLVWTDYEIHVASGSDTLENDVNFETFVALDDGLDTVDLGALDVETE